MDSLLDTIWEKITIGAIALANGFDALLSPLHFLGPAPIIFLLAILTVFITKGLNRIIITKRFSRLGKEFGRLYNLRQAAMECEDREKGALMEKNIDKAELNRVYYDYFFEGMLLGLVRKALPILIILAYINEYFKPERLIELFGRNYIFKFNSNSGDPLLIGVIPWYILSLVLVYLAWYLIHTRFGRFKKKDSTAPALASKKI